MTLSDFSGVPAGTRGVISEIYEEGVMIVWAGLKNHQMSALNTVESIGERMSNGEKMYSSRGWLTDGFSRDDLQYLAFATSKRPDVDPTVYRV